MNASEFFAAVAIDPALFARYLAEPGAVAAELGLSEGRLRVFRGGDRALITNLLRLEAALENIERGIPSPRGEPHSIFVSFFIMWFHMFLQLGYELRLMSSLNDVGGIPAKGDKLFIVADVRGVLHFRFFDGEGRMVVDTDEQRLSGRARQVEELRKQLEGLWPPHKLTQSETDRVIGAVISVVGDIPQLSASRTS
jgi:hypothetical protein